MNPPLDELHRKLLSWNPSFLARTQRRGKDKEAGELDIDDNDPTKWMDEEKDERSWKLQLDYVPLIFDSVQHYHRIFFPLLVEELKAALQQSLVEMKSMELSRSSQSSFSSSSSSRSRDATSDSEAKLVVAQQSTLQREFVLLDLYAKDQPRTHTRKPMWVDHDLLLLWLKVDRAPV
jgi:hypothetical protein